MTPGDGNTVPVDGELRFDAEDPDEDKLEVSVLIWSGDIKGEISPDWIYTEEPSKKSNWTISLSDDFSVDPNATYTWQVRISDDQGESIQSQRFTFKTAALGYSRKTIEDSSVSGDISLMPFHALDIVPSKDVNDLSREISFDIALLDKPGSTDITSKDSSSLGVDFNASADRVLDKSVAFNITLSGDANSVILPMAITFAEDDFKALSIDLSGLTEKNLLGEVHPVKIVDGHLFDLVEIAGSKSGDLFNVSKTTPSENIYTVEFSLLLLDSDSADVKAISAGGISYLAVWDGKKDGKLSDPITAIRPKKAVQPSPSPSDDSSSGGCNISTTPIALVLLIPLLGMLKR